MSNSDVAQAAERLRESRPPATDTFTYLTIVEKSLSPAIIPTLHEILQDAELTQDIGWDLVEMLIAVPGSDECLKTIAQLGNPREVILKVLEVLEKLTGAAEDKPGNQEEEYFDADHTARFVTLLGMLGILHKRLEVKAPSRFVHTTLQTIYRCYDPGNGQMTAAIIDLVRSLSGRRRPPLPMRKSSTALSTPFQISDEAKNAPDPEAEQLDTGDFLEPGIVTRLLQSFVTCTLEAFVNSNQLNWPTRLLELYRPEKNIPGRKTMTQSFKDVPDLQAKDALMGQLVAIAGDLGLSTTSRVATEAASNAINTGDPLSIETFDSADDIELSTAGVWCLWAYSVFATELFDADYRLPDMDMFPDHFGMLKGLLSQDPQNQPAANPGTVEALLVLGLWLDNEKRVADGDGQVDLVGYHHLLTVMALFHPSLQTRNAATALAGMVLHSFPDENEKLKVMDDLLENCDFSSLKACTVSWLQEEVVSAQATKGDGIFASAECIERLQYTLFPNLEWMNEAGDEIIEEYWDCNYPFLLQSANFAYLLLAGESFKQLVPLGMGAAIGERFARPLQSTAKKLLQLRSEKKSSDVDGGPLTSTQVEILANRLEKISF